MRPSKKVDASKTRRTSALLVTIFVLVLVALLAQNASTIFSATIEKTLRSSFQQSELVGYEVRQDTPLQVIATIRLPAGSIPDNSEIINAQNKLEETLGEPVELSVVIQPIVDATVARTNAEVEALIAQVLDEQLADMTVLGFIFDVGNPTRVLAIVQTDLESGSEEINDQTVAAEQTIAQELGLPVALSIITVESYDSTGSVDATDQALSETIEETLIESLTCCEILSFSFQVGNPFIVTASVTTEMDPASDEFLAQIQATENALSMALGWPVRLSVIVTQPTPMPTETKIPILPSATPTLEPTEEIPTAVPPTPELPTPEPPTPEPPTPEPTVAPPTLEPTAEPTGETPTIEPSEAPPTATELAPTPTP